MGPHQEQHDHQESQILLVEAEGRQCHDGDLDSLDDDDQPGLFELVGEAPGRRRKKKEGQDENAGGDRRPELPVNPGLSGDAKRHQDDERILEDVVVQRSHELGDEERQEAPALQDGEIAMAHGVTGFRSDLLLGGS